MPTVVTHPAISLAVRAVTGGTLTSNRLLLIAALCSVVPDVDTVGFVVGIPYESLFGHRGLTHSLPFALLLACCALPFANWLNAKKWWAFTFVFLSTTSHGILDALTDDGLGVAFFSPFSNQRFFLPWRPIPASPIGIVEALSSSGLHVFTAEAVLIWLPCLLVAVVAKSAQRLWPGKAINSPMRSARDRSGLATSVWPAVLIATALAVTSIYAGKLAGVGRTASHAHPRVPAHPAMEADEDQAMRTEAIENLERQAAKLAAHPGASCPEDFSALETGRTLRIAMFYGYDEHEGKVHDRANAHAMSHVLTSECRGVLSTCGFAIVSRSRSGVGLMRTIGGRRIEVNLFTSAVADDATEDAGLLLSHLEPDEPGDSVKSHFYRELVESDVVFYMGHSRLGGSIGFDKQTAVTTVVDAALRYPMRPVLAALRQRPTRLKILGMFSCESKKFFREGFRAANPSLSLIVTTGDIAYGPAEQASLGALEAVLSKSCGQAFHQSMISVAEPDPTMTYRFRGE